MPNKEEGKVFTPAESTEMLQFIATNMVTKDEFKEAIDKMATKEELQEVVDNMATKADFHTLRSEIRSSEQHMIDHMTRETNKVHGDLNVSLRREDEKVDEFICAVEVAGGISKKESMRLQRLGPMVKIS